MLTRVSHSQIKLLRVVWVVANLWVIGGVTGINHVILCSGLGRQENIQCPREYVIDVSSVTVASLNETQKCSINLIGFIADQVEQCKSSTGYRGRYEVFRRCHGNKRCSINGSVVDNLSFGPRCLTNMRVVWFSYSCHYVNSSSPSVVLLPLSKDRNRSMQGFYVEIFSPYYPCYTTRPKKTTSWWECKFSPKRNNKSSSISYVLKVKKLEIHRNSSACGDYLSFRLGNKNSKHYCGDNKRKIEHWNEEIIFDNTTEYLTVRFQSNTFAGGARFWLAMEVFEDEDPIEVNLTCNGQDNIPPLLSDCSLLPVTPATPNEIIPNTDKLYNFRGLPFGLLVGLIVILLLLVGVAVYLLVCLIRRRRRIKNDDIIASAATVRTGRDPEVTPDAHGSVPDDIANTENADEPTYSVNTATNTGPYEEVEHYGAFNSEQGEAASNSIDVTRATPGDSYENISPIKEYETLKRLEYENIPTMQEPKIYTVLDRTEDN